MTPTPSHVATDELIETLERLEKEATPGDLSTAEGGAREQDDVECPACGGEGVLSATDYCNFDGAATGVQFFGIGPEFGAHERLWRFFMQNRKAIISALKENLAWEQAHADAMSALRLRLRGAREALVEARAAIQDWGSYAGKYFQEKHDLAGDLAKIDAALQPQGDAKP